MRRQKVQPEESMSDRDRKWRNMSAEEKKERIDGLWAIVRKDTQAGMFAKRLKRIAEQF